jgi:predicted PurR-regulated permease PerM
MLNKILAVLVMILTVVGSLVCAAFLVGAWAINTPLTNAATGSILLVENFVELAEQVTGQIDDNLELMLGEVQEIEKSLTEMEDDQKAQVSSNIQRRLDNLFGSLLAKSEAVIDPLSKGAAALNRSLRLANLLPGVEVPPVAEKLDSLSKRLAELSEQIDNLQQAINEVNFDGSRVLAVVSTITKKIEAVEQEVSRYEAGMELTLRAAQELRVRIPGWVDLFSIVISLLAILLGAGQVSLFIHARHWYKEASCQT